MSLRPPRNQELVLAAHSQSAGHVAAANLHHLAGDPVGLLGAEEENCVGNVLWLAPHSGVDQGKSDSHRSGLDKTAMGTGVRFACITHGGPRPRGSARVPNQSSPLGGGKRARTT